MGPILFLFSIFLLFCFGQYKNLFQETTAKKPNDFGWFNLDKLLEKANQNEHSHELASYIFHQNFADKTFAIHNPLSSEIPVVTYERHHTVHIYDLESAVNILKTFGPLILKLTLISENATDHTEIGKLIGQHCTQSLMELQLAIYIGNILDDAQKPFVNVHKLSLDRKVNNLKNGSLALDMWFPNIRELHLNAVEVDDGSFLDGTFPLIETLSINFLSYENADCLNESDVGALLAKNSQIKHLTTAYAHVIDYLDKNTELEKLVIRNCVLCGDTFDKLMRVCANNSKLVEVSLDLAADVDEEKIVEFIKMNKNLQKIELGVPKAVLHGDFQENFGSEWNISEIHWDRELDSPILFVYMER